MLGARKGVCIEKPSHASMLEIQWGNRCGRWVGGLAEILHVGQRSRRALKPSGGIPHRIANSRGSNAALSSDAARDPLGDGQVCPACLFGGQPCVVVPNLDHQRRHSADITPRSMPDNDGSG